MTRSRFSSQAAYAHDKLRRMILDGELASGARIGVREMAAQLGTSTGPVRDALIQMSNEMLVQGGHGLPWSVARISRDVVDGGMVVREALEGQSARLATLAAKPQDIEKICGLAEQIDARVDAGLSIDEVTIELDRRFHRLIATLSGSPQLLAEVERWQIVMDWARLCLRKQSRGIESHVTVAEAIASGDPDFAERRMRHHILHPWQEMKWEIEEKPETENTGATQDASAVSGKT